MTGYPHVRVPMYPYHVPRYPTRYHHPVPPPTRTSARLSTSSELLTRLLIFYTHVCRLRETVNTSFVGVDEFSIFYTLLSDPHPRLRPRLRPHLLIFSPRDRAWPSISLLLRCRPRPLQRTSRIPATGSGRGGPAPQRADTRACQGPTEGSATSQPLERVTQGL